MAKWKAPSVKQVEAMIKEMHEGRVKPIKISRGCILSAALELAKMGEISVAKAERVAQGEISDSDIQSLRLDRCCDCGHQYENGMMPGEDNGALRYRECTACGSEFTYLESEGRLT